MTEVSNTKFPVNNYQSWITYVRNHNPTDNFKPATEPSWWYNYVTHKLFVYTGSRLKTDGTGHTFEWEPINTTAGGDVPLPPASDSINFVDNSGAIITAGSFLFQNTQESGIAVQVQNSNNAILISVRNGGITTSHLQSSAVTVDKLADLSVLTDKIQNGAVTAEKLSQALQDSINVTLPSKISLSNLNDSTTIRVVKTQTDASFDVIDSSIGESKLTQELINRIDASTTLQFNDSDVTQISEGDNIDMTLTNGNLRVATISSGGTVDETRIFSSAEQKNDVISKTDELTIVQENVETSIQHGALWADNLQEAVGYTVLADDITGTNFQIRLRVQTYNNANFGANLRIVVSRGNEDAVEIPIIESYLTASGTVSGATDFDGNDISTIDFVTLQVPVASNFEADDSLQIETHTSENILQVQKDVATNRTNIATNRAGVEENRQSIQNLNVPAPVSAVIRDLGNDMTETSSGVGEWKAIDPSPYSRFTLTREAAIYQQGENRTSFGDNQITGNTFTDITPQINVISTDPEYFPEGESHPSQTWRERTTYDRQKLGMENASGETTPIQDVFNKIITFDFHVSDVNNYPTTDTPVLTIGADDAHPMYTARREGDVVNLYAQTITGRSAGSTTYTRTSTLNINALVIDGTVGGETQVFQPIPTDWVDADHLRLRFFVYQKSRHETFLNEVIVGNDVFDIVDLRTAVPDTTFTVSFTLDDTTSGGAVRTISTTYRARYRGVADGAGNYNLELSNASLTQNLGSDFEAHIFVDRGTVETYGDVNTYTGVQISTSMSSGDSRTIVSTFFPVNHELSNQNARLFLLYSDSGSVDMEHNLIDLQRTRGEDGLDFSRVTVNDIGVNNASEGTALESYRYSVESNSLPPDHNDVRLMWQNMGHYLGAFFLDHATRIFVLDDEFRSKNTKVEELHLAEGVVITPDSSGIIIANAGSNINLSKDPNSENTFIISSTAGGGGTNPTTNLMFNGQTVLTLSTGDSVTASYDTVSSNLNFTVTHPTLIDTVQVHNGTALTPVNRTIRLTAGDNVSITRPADNASHAVISADNAPIGSISVDGTAVVPDTNRDIDFIAGTNVTLATSGHEVTISSTDSVLMFNNSPVGILTLGSTLSATYTSANRTLNLNVMHPVNISTIEDSNGNALAPVNRVVRLEAGTGITIERNPTFQNRATISSTIADAPIQTISVNGVSVTPDANDIDFVAGTGIELSVSGNTVTMTASGGGSGGGSSKSVSTSTFTTTDGTASTGGTAGTFTTYQWYSGGRSRSATTNYDGTKTFEGISYTATPDAYSDIGDDWETMADESSANMTTLFDLRGGGRRLYTSIGFSRPTSIRDLNDFAIAESSTGSNPLFIANFTPNNSTFPPTSSSNTQSLLVEIRRPTAVNTVFTLVFQQVLTDPTYVRLPDIEVEDILIVALPSDAPVDRRATLRFRRQLTAPVPATDATAGDTTKVSSTETDDNDDLTFASERDRDTVVNKSKLLQYETRTVVDPEILPFLFLDRTLEVREVSVHDDDLTEFVDNPIFSIKESLYRTFIVDSTTNIRIIRTRDGTRETVDDTLTFEARGTVDNATNTTGTEVNEPYYCVRATFDIQDNDIFEIEGHTSKNFSYPVPRFNGQEYVDLTIGEGITPTYDPISKRLNLEAQAGFESFILRYLSVSRSTGIALNKEDSTYNNVLQWSYTLSSSTSSNVISSSYLSHSSGLFSVTGRYSIKMGSGITDAVLIAYNAPGTESYNRAISRRINNDTLYSFYISSSTTFRFLPIKVVNGVEETFDSDDFSLTISTNSDTAFVPDKEIWYRVESRVNPSSNYVLATMLYLDGRSPEALATTVGSGNLYRLIEPDLTSIQTATDIGDVFNFVSLTSDEITALDLNGTTGSYDDRAIFMEFNTTGSFLINDYPVPFNIQGTSRGISYILHVRPTRVNNVITGYSRIYSSHARQVLANTFVTGDDKAIELYPWYDQIHLNVSSGDLLLMFVYSLDGTAQTARFSIGRVTTATTPATILTYFKLMRKTLTISGAFLEFIDFDSSDTGVLNLFRQRTGGGGSTAFFPDIYNITTFDYHSSTDPPTGADSLISDVLEVSSFLGVSLTSALPAQTYLGLSNIRTPVEYSASLIQDKSSSIMTYSVGFRYPNNGYDATLSSANITSIFNLKSLTEAEMQVIYVGGTFASTNMVLEAQNDGIIIFQPLTTSSTTPRRASITQRSPTYNDSGTLVSITTVNAINIDRINTTPVTEVSADSDDLWPQHYFVKEGDLFTIEGSITNTTEANELAVNFIEGPTRR